MFNKFRNEKGFTLVEVIVVAVIVAVLAAVAIPLYMGYVHDSRLNVSNNVAGSVASACGATKQQDSTLITAITGKSPYTSTSAAIAVITLKGLNGVDNLINVPVDFSVSVAAATVVCSYTKDATVISKTFAF